MEKAIHSFDTYIKKRSDNELNAFDETLEIFLELINPEFSADQQDLINRITEWVTFENVEDLQGFFDHYFAYRNYLVEYFQRIASIENEMELDRSVTSLAKELLKTMPDREDREIDVIEGVYLFYEGVMDLYGIDPEDDPEKTADAMVQAFGGQEPADILNFLVILAYESEENNEIDEEVLLALLKLMIVFTHWVYRLRQFGLIQAGQHQPLRQSFGEPANQPAYKVGRNDPCPCGSGKKYKKCCLNKPNDPPDSLKS